MKRTSILYILLLTVASFSVLWIRHLGAGLPWPAENFSSVLLLPLFFAFAGLRAQVGLLDDAWDWMLCLLIIAVATVGKLGGSAISARLSGMSLSDSRSSAR